MKLSSLAVLSVVLPSTVDAVCKDRSKSFSVQFDGKCNYENLLAAFDSIVFKNGTSRVYGCSTGTAKEELDFLLDGASVHDICSEGFKNYAAYPFKDIPMEYDDFLQLYYNGGTHWNEEQETYYGEHGEEEPSNVLRSRNDVIGDAARVQDVYDAEGRAMIVEWPDYLSNFAPESCQNNAAYCCWPGDRQANDNNGNCRSPYDRGCIDRVPSDNVNVCYIESARGVISSGVESETGFGIYPFDDDNNNNRPTDRGEGQVHCHGFAWAEDDVDQSAVYKGNNLFYVSMYDHMSQRGYVRNLPGAPMCACAEQMPIVERADCTQMHVDEEFQFTFSNQVFKAELKKLYIDFAACQGYDRHGNNDDNDLWSYMNRLFQEGKVSADKLAFLSTMLVGENPDNCDVATDRFMQHKGYITGYNEDTSTWLKFAARDALGDTYWGKTAFCSAYGASPHKIIRRISPNSYHQHDDIYYKRTNQSEGEAECLEYNIYHNLLNGRSKVAGNVWNVDFQIFSTYQDALDGKNENAWDCASLGGYKYDQGFPGDCGPTPLIHNDKRNYHDQETRFEPRHGKYGTAFYLEVDGLSKSLEFGGSNIPGPVNTLPKSGDIGNCYFPGTFAQTYNNETGYTLHITGGCNDVWNSYDSCNYLYDDDVSDEVEMVVQVDDVKTVNHEWNKLGLMYRASVDPTSQYCSVLYTTSFGVVTHIRYNQGGGSSWYGYDGKGKHDYKWMKLTVRNGICSAFKSKDGNDWIRIDEPRYIDFKQTTGVARSLEGTSSKTAGIFLTSNSWHSYYSEATLKHFEMKEYVCKEESRRLGTVSRL